MGLLGGVEDHGAARPPPYSVNASKNAADVTSIHLVPFGGTNIRISVFPWTCVVA